MSGIPSRLFLRAILFSIYLTGSLGEGGGERGEGRGGRGGWMVHRLSLVGPKISEFQYDFILGNL